MLFVCVLYLYELGYKGLGAEYSSQKEPQLKAHNPLESFVDITYVCRPSMSANVLHFGILKALTTII